MKLIVAILRDEDSDHVSQSLISSGFRVTRIASTGGFLRRGSTTFMIGVEDEKVDEAIQLVQDSCTVSIEPSIKRATLFVLNVEKYSQI
jgi:uncharacterized protein YaaQ